MNVNNDQSKFPEKLHFGPFGRIPTIDSNQQAPSPGIETKNSPDVFQKLAIPTSCIGSVTAPKTSPFHHAQNTPLLIRHFYTVPSTTALEVEKANGKTEKATVL